jgi:lipoprotein-anchoring transpeptidase ErfK/SrfK
MAMARNESVARMVMFLCFGTAILSLAVHWHTMKTTGQLGNNNSGSSTIKNLAVANNNQVSRLEVGESAVAASVPTSSKRYVVAGLNSEFVKNKDSQVLASNNKSYVSQSHKNQVLVDISDRRVYVYHDDVVIASYPIAVGKKGWETPTGDFKVMHKEYHPIWKHPITGQVFDGGTNSPLGDRWIGFWSDGRNEIGFHGTPNVDLVGSAVSHGCLRMRNADVRMLYNQVDLGTTVLVRD